MAFFRLGGQDLEGKVTVITGASRGIGRAIAMNLASRGCSILGTCSGPDSLHLFDSMNNEIGTLYLDANLSGKKPKHARIPKIVGIPADISSPTCPATIVSALETNFQGHVDIFVNNAADSMPGELGNLNIEEIQRSLVCNVQTPVLIVDEFVKRKMFRTESRIVYISSIRSRQPWSEQLMYAAGKSAGESLCRTWSMAFGGREERFSFMAGTTANSVSVGLTETDSVMQCPPDALEGFKKEFFPLQSIERFGQPEDVADVVGMLCGRDARWITGQVISASGGGIKIG